MGRSRNNDAAARLVAPGSFGADLGIRVGWGSADAGWTALCLAVDQRQYQLSKRLCEVIAAGTAGSTANVSARDARGASALDLARSRGFMELHALLLAFGADETPPPQALRALPTHTPSARWTRDRD